MKYFSLKSSYDIVFIELMLLLVCVNSLKDENEKSRILDRNAFTDYSYYKDRKLQAGRMYFAIAAPPSEQSYSRAFNKTLMNITQLYLSGISDKSSFNFTLDTLVIELPKNGNFSARLLESLCEKFEGKHVVAVLIIGDSPAAFMVSLAATHAGVPVLWARGRGGFLPGFRSMVSFLIVGNKRFMCDFLLFVLHTIV